jgi:hypothetical protein
MTKDPVDTALEKQLDYLKLASVSAQKSAKFYPIPKPVNLSDFDTGVHTMWWFVFNRFLLADNQPAYG